MLNRQSVVQVIRLIITVCRAALSLFSFGGRAPHPEGTWPKTLLHKPMGVASTERGARLEAELGSDRLAAKGRGIRRRKLNGPN